MFFYIDKVVSHDDGTKTGQPIESYLNSHTFMMRMKELLHDPMYEGVFDEENKERRNYNFGYEIMDNSQSRVIDKAVYLSQHDFNRLDKEYPYTLFDAE